MKLVMQFLLLSAFAATALSASSKKPQVINVEDVLKKLASDKNFKSLVENMSSNLKRAATMSIISGTLKTARKMETNILQLIHDFVKIIQKATMTQAVVNYKKIEDTMKRDKKAIEILSNAMKIASNSEKLSEYQQEMNEMSKNITKIQEFVPKNKKELMKKLQIDVNEHVNFLRKTVNATVQEAISHMHKKKSEMSSTPSTITSSSSLSLDTHINDILKHETYNLPQFYIRMPIWSIYPANVESYYHRFRRQNDVDDVSGNTIENEEKEDDFDAEFDNTANSGNGGLAGLIGSLSGGEGGSDVGALVGVLSGLITNLFGPGGLDVPSLLSTGTSLLAGLLGGDENFGKVLASYIGIAVDGLSGGGGADNNGAFFGNFVGTLFAQLSADPEADDEDNAAPQPKVFLESFLKGFDQTKQKRGTDEMNSSSNRNYIFEFLSNIVSSVVGGITNLILNATLGSSGGSSKGSADLSAGSSQGSHAGSAYASQSSASTSSMMPSNKPK